MAKSSRRGARRRKPQSKRQLPGWLLLFTGLVAGLFIAFLYHLARVQQQMPTAPSQASVQSQKAHNQSSRKHLPKFDFYAILPKKEVVMPRADQPQNQSPEKSGTKAAKTSPVTLAEKQPVMHKKATSHSQHQAKFLLQAGSFRHKKAAEGLRAKFILEGFNVHVQPVVLDEGETWYRVMVGPFSNHGGLDKAQEKLAAKGVDSLPIRIKGNAG